MPTVLSVWAHPDDETFGPAGLIRALHEQGIRNVIISATRGEQGRLGEPPLTTREHLGAVRTTELERACEIMGVDQLIVWDYPDGKLEDVEPETLRDRILAVIVEQQPDIMLTFGPDGIYGHPDHVAIHATTTQAFAQYLAEHPNQTPARLYYVTPDPDSLEQALANEAGNQDAPPPLPPTALIDVAAYADVKRAALQAHATQHQDWEPLLERNNNWLTCVYLHRAYPPVAADEPPETELFA